MSKKNIVGVFICVLIFTFGFTVHGNVSMYFNLAGALIVIGGTFGAILVCYRVDQLWITFYVLLASYRSKVKEPEEIVEVLVDLSVKSRFKGILSLEEDENETTILFLRRALGFLVDGLPSDYIRESLSTEMYFFKIRREDCERVLRNMSSFAPSFGLVGSVVGLIGMLAGVGDTATILKTVPIALTSTLYGVVLSNFFLSPFATIIEERTAQEILLQKIIMEGVIAIGSEMDPRLLEHKLKSFITPSSRNIKLVSLKRIQERFNIKPKRTLQKSRPGAALKTT
ncbi:MAG: MotA/TolQ/ExbB proton channel family protein [Desulfobulbaceae bacterium]|nr:MotA/TolQ/ExbB proton channel family protein [Desulfobulbaceae bacterium]